MTPGARDAVAQPAAAQAQRRLGDRFEHGEGDDGTAGPAPAVAAGPDPRQRELDVAQRVSRAGLDERLDLAQPR
jgi:hypothetical protein